MRSKANYGQKTQTLKTGTYNCPKFPDKSTGLKGPSVDKDATRSATAPNPKTLGPRSDGM